MIMFDIKMPEKCGQCPCFHAENPMYCQAVKADRDKRIVAPYRDPRPEWCPLIECKEVITYKDCSDAMLKMWIENVLTDGEYNRIMDKLNEWYIKSFRSQLGHE